MDYNLIVPAFIALAALITIAKAIVIVPQNTALLVERLGKYHSTLNAGIEFVLPYI